MGCFPLVIENWQQNFKLEKCKLTGKVFGLSNYGKCIVYCIDKPI